VDQGPARHHLHRRDSDKMRKSLNNPRSPGRCLRVEGYSRPAEDGGGHRRNVAAQGGRKHPYQTACQIDTSQILYSITVVSAFVCLDDVVSGGCAARNSIGFCQRPGRASTGQPEGHPTGGPCAAPMESRRPGRYGLDSRVHRPLAGQRGCLNPRCARPSKGGFLTEPRDASSSSSRNLQLSMDSVQLEFEPMPSRRFAP